MPTNDRGFRLRLSLPGPEDLAPFPELATLAAEYRRLQGERQAAAQEAKGLEQSRHWAKARDTAALADALRRQEPDPGLAELREVDRRLGAATRTGEALDQALDDVEGELQAVVARHRETWIREQIPLIADARGDLAAATEAWIFARRRLGELEGMAGWLTEIGTGPKMGLRVRPARPVVAGIPVGPNQAAIPWEAVAAAMREELEPSAFERRYSELEEQAVEAGVATG